MVRRKQKTEEAKVEEAKQQEELPRLRDAEFHRLQRRYDAALNAYREARAAYEQLVEERSSQTGVLNFVAAMRLDGKIKEAERRFLDTEEALRQADNGFGGYKLEHKPRALAAYRERDEAIVRERIRLRERDWELQKEQEQLHRHAALDLGEVQPLPLGLVEPTRRDPKESRKAAAEAGYKSLETDEVRERLEREEAERLSNIASSEHTRDVWRIFSNPESLRQQLARENERQLGLGR